MLLMLEAPLFLYTRRASELYVNRFQVELFFPSSFSFFVCQSNTDRDKKEMTVLPKITLFLEYDNKTSLKHQQTKGLVDM